jgi:hypothetical protein
VLKNKNDYWNNGFSQAVVSFLGHISFSGSRHELLAAQIPGSGALAHEKVKSGSYEFLRI